MITSDLTLFTEFGRDRNGGPGPRRVQGSVGSGRHRGGVAERTTNLCPRATEGDLRAGVSTSISTHGGVGVIFTVGEITYAQTRVPSLQVPEKN